MDKLLPRRQVTFARRGRFGLGLSIVGAIQKLHGEKYGAENTDDGVVFWFDIKKA